MQRTDILKKMCNNFETKSPPVLILADFADGNWHATSFAMQFLHAGESPVSILQTYKSPDWGHFMMRKITPQLKEITKHELKQLKNKLLSSYSISHEQIDTLSIEGDLNSILHYKPMLKGSYNVVLGTYSSFADSCNMQNNCLEEIINTSQNPLFIIPGKFNGQINKKLLFVGNPNKIPSEQLTKHALNICNKTQSVIEILFILKKGIPKISNDVLNFYMDTFKKVGYEIKQIPNTSKSKGIKKHLMNSTRDLIIIENN